MKKVITVFTATRAEYHLLCPVIGRICEDDELCLDLIVSGTHLSEKYGNTVQEIVRDGYPIAETIKTIDDTGIINHDEIIAKTLLACSAHFERAKSDLLLVLGDRYELLGAVIAAMNAHIPIAHIHGGEITEGAIDEAIRHAVTKFSYLHFACCEAYRQRIIQLGEDPARVINAGALGVENILTQRLMSRETLESNLGFDLDKFCLVTFHPVTMEEGTATHQVCELYDALSEFKDYKYIVTGANADHGGREINEFWNDIGKRFSKQFLIIESLGMIRYLSAMSLCEMVIGNSSSGILEAPAFEKPTINIGDRQKGRIRAKSVIDCQPIKSEIVAAMRKGSESEFRESLSGMEQLYGNGTAGETILTEIKKALYNGINLKKSFYDIKFEGRA